MLRILPKTNIDFVGLRKVFYAISCTVLLAGLVSLVVKKGPRWGLDFTGGTLVEIKFNQEVTLDAVRNALSKSDIPSFELQSVAGQNVFIIRTQAKSETRRAAASQPSAKADPFAAPQASTTAMPAVQASLTPGEEEAQKILGVLTQAFPDQKLDILRREFVGPTVGKHLGSQTALAFLLTFIGIIIYVAFRFSSSVWGASGVIALVHDVFTVIGIFSIMNHEITVTVVAALLTIAGYSINDTIVIFDFMRERMKFRKSESLAEVINASLNETLSRTIITNSTVLVVSFALYFFGGEVIKDFAFAMVLGGIVGTYSSIGIAAPIIYSWEMRKSSQLALSSVKKK